MKLLAVILLSSVTNFDVKTMSDQGDMLVSREGVRKGSVALERPRFARHDHVDIKTIWDHGS